MKALRININILYKINNQWRLYSIRRGDLHEYRFWDLIHDRSLKHKLTYATAAARCPSALNDLWRKFQPPYFPIGIIVIKLVKFFHKIYGLGLIGIIFLKRSPWNCYNRSSNRPKNHNFRRMSIWSNIFRVIPLDTLSRLGIFRTPKSLLKLNGSWHHNLICSDLHSVIPSVQVSKRY